MCIFIGYSPNVINEFGVSLVFEFGLASHWLILLGCSLVQVLGMFRDSDANLMRHSVSVSGTSTECVCARVCQHTVLFSKTFTYLQQRMSCGYSCKILKTQNSSRDTRSDANFGIHQVGRREFAIGKQLMRRAAIGCDRLRYSDRQMLPKKKPGRAKDVKP